MRLRPHLLLPLALLSLYGCQCGRTKGETVEARPEANVLAPTDKSGDEYLLDFGRVRAGSSSTKHITIENRGRSDWNVSAFVLRDGSSPELAVSAPVIPAVVPTGSQLDATVTWSPLLAGDVAGYIDLDSDDPSQPRITVKIVGIAEAPGILVCTKADDGSTLCDDQVKPRNLAIDFGLLTLTDPPSKRTVTVRNNSPLALNITSAALAEGTSPEFTVSTINVKTLQPNTETELTLTYKPIDGGYDTGQLEIVSDDPKKSVVRVDLKGGGKAPKICATPLAVDYGNVVQGTNVDKDVVFTNCGVSDLQITKVEMAAGQTPEFSIVTAPTLPLTLPPNGKITVPVRYAPTNLGMDDGKLNVSSDDANNKNGFIRLHGNGIKEPSCDLDVSPRLLDFGQVSTRGYSEKTLFGINVGQKACTLSAVTGPTGSANFTVRSGPAAPLNLPPNASFSVTIRYTPTAAQADTASLAFASDDPSEPTITVNLKAQGTSPGPCDFQFLPGALQWGAQPMGTSKPLTISLYNFGTDECFVTDATIAGGSSSAFTITKSPMIPDTISSNGKMDFEVSFAPKAAGAHTGTLQVKAGANFFSTRTVTAALSGQAAAASLCISPQNLDYGTVAPGGMKDLQFTLTSCGGGTIELRGLNFDAGTSAEFLFVNKPQTPYQLAAGASLPVTVRYAPTTNGPDFGRVSVLSNDARQPSAPVLLRGNASGCLTKTLFCAPAKLDFPKTAVGQTSSKTFSCLNAGQQDVAISSVKLAAGTSSEFALSYKSLPPVLPAGQSLRFVVDYTPSAAGTDTGTVEIASDDCQRPAQSIALSAEGVNPVLPQCLTPRTFTPRVKWEFKNPATLSNMSSVWMTPAVVNLTDDNGDGRIDEDDVPDVVFASFDNSLANVTNPDPTPPAVLRALDGKTGNVLWTVTDPALRVDAAAQIAVGDIDGDNKPEIIATLRVVNPGTGLGGFQGKYITGRMVAFENDGSYKWTSDFWTRDNNEIEDASAISIADLDNDGVPEIVIGASVFGADGRLLWEGTAGRGSVGHGVFSVVADLDGDGRQEVIGGNTAYSPTGQVLWTYGSRDGLPVVIDVEGDGTPEIALRTDIATITILDAQGKKKYGPWTLSNTPMDACPSAMTAGDFDGDKKPELAFAAGSFAAVMEPSTGKLNWQDNVDDYSGQCGASGAAAFDFEGDGVMELVYADATTLYALRGSDGATIYSEPRTSATLFETPVIADVDGDGHADIIYSNDRGAGLRAMSNSTGDWVAARRIWNQFGYHVTNVSEGGTIPRVETPSWKKNNSYRANEARCK